MRIMASPFAVLLQNVSFRYTADARFILHEVDLAIPKGAYLSVVGENGSGKSTLVKLVLKLLKPSTGTIAHFVQRVGSVPQTKMHTLYFPLTLYEMLNSYRRLLRISHKWVVDAVLEEVGMRGAKKKLVYTLSGGELQKVYIARSLIGDPDLLVLDELSTGIDSRGQKDIYALLKGLNTSRNVTVISVEHNLDAAITNSTQIFHLSEGHGHLCNPQQYVSEFLDMQKKDALACAQCRSR